MQLTHPDGVCTVPPLSCFVLLAKGPHCQRHTWLGYEGGGDFRTSVVDARRKEEEEQSKSTRSSEERSFPKGTEASSPKGEAHP